MAVGRNWLNSLWPASYKGVPFQVERDNEDGGRRIVIHEFPMRDEPFNEDLGEAKREFEVTAYVAADDVENRAKALTGVCAARGPGVLVLPTHGGILVRCLTFKRDREKDRTGKIAFSLHFVREGASSALISFASLANLVFAGGDNVQAAVAAFAASAIALLRQTKGASSKQPDFVVAAAGAALQDGAALLESIRTSSSVDPAVSAVQRGVIQTIYDAGIEGAPVADLPMQFSQLVAVARALGDGMVNVAPSSASGTTLSVAAVGTSSDVVPAPQATTAIAGFEAALRQTVIAAQPVYLSASAKAADENRMAGYLVARVAVLTAYSEAIVRASIPDRPAAITLRANVAEHFEAALNAISATQYDLYRAVLTLRDSVIDYLSRAILDRAPVVGIEANRSLPSLWWSHRLYVSADRSRELAARARAPHPSFMPLAFEALAR